MYISRRFPFLSSFGRHSVQNDVLGMILPEHIAPCPFVPPYRFANDPHSLSAVLTQACKWVFSDGKFLVLESGKFLSL